MAHDCETCEHVKECLASSAMTILTLTAILKEHEAGTPLPIAIAKAGMEVVRLGGKARKELERREGKTGLEELKEEDLFQA
jgi:hypothetical protein